MIERHSRDKTSRTRQALEQCNLSPELLGRFFLLRRELLLLLLGCRRWALLTHDLRQRVRTCARLRRTAVRVRLSDWVDGTRRWLGFDGDVPERRRSVLDVGWRSRVLDLRLRPFRR